MGKKGRGKKRQKEKVSTMTQSDSLLVNQQRDEEK